MIRWFGLLGILLLVGCSTIDPVTGLETRNLYSINQDVHYGNQFQNSTIESLEQRGVTLNADPVRVAQLQEMVARIAAVSDLPDLPYEVTLIHTNIVNAMAAPGGKIMVYEGLWDPDQGLAKTEDEIAAVIAHEIAHVNARHSTEAMTRALPGSIAATLALTLAKGSESEQLYKTMIAGGMFWYQGIWLTKYSRADEHEADIVGMMYMAKAGYNPQAAVEIWERAAERRSGADPADSIFSTHPVSTERVYQLKLNLPRAQEVYEQVVSQ